MGSNMLARPTAIIGSNGFFFKEKDWKRINFLLHLRYMQFFKLNLNPVSIFLRFYLCVSHYLYAATGAQPS